MKQESILFAAPIYGGLATVPFMQSMLALQEQLVLSQFPHGFLFTTNESLITRGRNTTAARFLKEKQFDILMFVDADISFSPDDVGKLYALNADIATGCYRMKKPGSKYAAWVNGDLIDDLSQFKGPIEVDYAGTGFMMIKRRVFEKLMEAHPEWKYEEGNGVGECWGFFQDPIEDFGGNRIQISEDYFLCRRWRELGGKVMMDPTVKLVHHGSYAYG